MATETKNTAVAEVKQTAVSTEIASFESFAGAGTENLKASDVLIPRLTIIQGLSPQRNKNKAEYIQGAEEGHIVDVATGDLFKEGIIFLPVYYRKDYLEWAPRASGKGLVAVHPNDDILDQCTRDEKNRPILPNGNYIGETAQWFGLNLSSGRRPCFIPMASTQLKRSRKWMTMVANERIIRPDGSDFQAPIFYRTYTMSTAAESNNDGDWYVWAISRGLSLPEYATNWQQILGEATKFRDTLIAGEARANLEGMSGDSDSGGDVIDSSDSGEGAM